MSLPPLPTGTFKVGFEESVASNIGEVLVPLGTDKYTVIAFCPFMTNYYGTGVPGRELSSDSLSGFTIQQRKEKNNVIMTREDADVISRSRSMLELYGSDTTGFA